MDFQYYGANCVRISNKKVNIVLDDNSAMANGLASIATKEDIVIFTSQKGYTGDARFMIEGPGEYEIAEVSVRGIPTKAHLDADGQRATIYSIHANGFSIGVLGHIYPSLTDEQLEELGIIDVLIVPVGGNGYTLDATGASKLIKQIDPKIVIPTHYNDSGISYEVPQADLDLFLAEMGTADTESIDVLKLKESDLGDKTQVIVLNRTK